MSETTNQPCLNTDRELWRERPDDYYADSIHVTEGGGIGINCGGTVIVKPVREWHRLAMPSATPLPLDAAARDELARKARDIGERIKALREAHPDEVHHDVLFKMAAIAGEIEATLAARAHPPIQETDDGESR